MYLGQRPRGNIEADHIICKKEVQEMELNSLECPKCGAALIADFSSGKAKCRFCDSEFYFGNGDGSGKNDLEILGRLADQANRLSELKNKYEELVKKKNTLYYLRIAMWCICVLCAVLCVSYIADVFKHAAFNWKGFLTAFIISPLAFISTKPISAKIEQKLSEMDSVKAEEDQLNQEYNLDMLPKEYRSRVHIQALYDLVLSGRASTIPEAIRAYEERRYYEQMLNIQREQLELQRKRAAKSQESERYEDDDDSSDSISWKAIGMLIGGAVLFHKFFDD